MRALAASLALTLTVGSALAQDATEGAAIYATFCATCHGAAGHGDGPMAELMTLQPTDLTRLAANNEGVLPVERIVTQIDGRDPLLAHGGAMPLFGAFFEGEDTAIKAPSGQPILTSRPIVDLVTWLETVQAE